MGVEPTKDLLAALPGFEVRTPHRGRFSSNRWRLARRRTTKQIEPLRVDAAQISAACGQPVAIKEFENLDRNLAAVVEPVA